jgi:predicted dehydrogenase
MSSGHPLKAVVVGAGAGGTLSIDALMASDRYELVGVADVSEAARERVRQRTGVPTFADHQELFEATAPDVICISTYAPTHLPITEVALAQPGLRGLLVEKPLGDTVAAGRAVIESVRGHHLPVVVPHGQMAMAAPLQIVDEVRGQRLGTLRVVEIECRGWDTINAGIHWLQFFVALAGDDPVVSVLAAADSSTRTFRDGMQVETEAVIVARCASGLKCVMNIGDDVPLPGEETALFRIIGEDGYIEYSAFGDSYVRTGSENGRERVQPPAFDVSGHQWHLERLADQIDASAPDYVLAESSLRALEIVEAAYLSNRVGARVGLPEFDYTAVPVESWDPGTPYSGTGGGRNGREL